jgi:hypothetical protein
MKVHADLKPSRMRLWVEAALYVSIAGLLLLSALPLWAISSTLLVMLAVYLLTTRQRGAQPRLLQLIQLDRASWVWYSAQASTQHGLQTTRVEGSLLQVQRVAVLIVLHVQIESAPDTAGAIRRERHVIWRDQVDADNWRRLVVLARFWTDPPVDA